MSIGFGQYPVAPFKVHSMVEVRSANDWTAKYVGKVGKVVMAGRDINNQWVFDLEIDGVEVTSFRQHHLRNYSVLL
jgi:hypothetical protein